MTLGGTLTGFSTASSLYVTGITVGVDGNLWYSQNTSGGSAVGRSTTAGNTVTVATLGSGVGAADIAEGSDGHVWFTEQGTNKIGTLDWFLGGGGVMLDPGQGLQNSIDGQPGSFYSPSTGLLTVQVPIDFNLNTETCTCGASALTYNSDSIDVMPAVQVSLSSSSGDPVPTTLQARLIWNNGTPGPWTTISITGLTSGGAYSFTLQNSTPVTATGVYPWEVDIQASVSGATITRDLEGYLPVVANASSPFGAGWSLAKDDQLVSVAANGAVPAGLLYVYGSGQSRFFQSLGNGQYLSPANDFGTLSSAANGGVTTYTYAAKNQLKYTFNGSGQLVTVTDPHGLTKTFTYSGSNLTGVDFYDGGHTTFHYASGLLTEVDEPGARKVLLGHDGSGNLTGVTDADGGLRTLSYDSNHHLLADQLGSRSATYAFDPTGGSLSTITMANGETTSISPAWLRELKTTSALGGQNPPDLTTDRLNRTTTLTLDGLGRLLQAQAPDGSTWKQTLDFAGQPTAATDALSHTTSFAYVCGPSGLGDLTQIAYPDGTTSQYQYNATFHEPTVLVDQNGNLTTMAYDATTGDLLTVSDALNHTTTYAYYQTGGTSNGEVLSVTDPNGNVTSYAYDSSRRVTTEIDGYGSSVATTATMIYDAAGNMLSETTGVSATASYAHAVTTSYAYDALRRMTEQIRGYGTAQQATSVYIYDAAGDLLSVTDPNGNVTSYGYDSAGHMTQEVDGYGTSVATTATMIYDAAGNLLSETTGQSTTASYAHTSTTSYAYDGQNRVTQEIQAYGASLQNATTTGYDADGNVLSVTDANGDVTSYAYDALNRVGVTLVGSFFPHAAMA